MNEQSNEAVTLDYTEYLQSIEYEVASLREETQCQVSQLTVANEYLGYISGFLLFFVAITLCVFAYKFIRLFI